jgi:hypothetical protein
MSSKGLPEDIPFLLYMVPFLLSGGYGIYLWVKSGLSRLLPTTVYLTVTRDPYVFAIGSFAVLLGVIAEVSSAEVAERQAKVKSVAYSLQIIAVASFLLAVLCAWYSNGFVHISETANDFIVGRYSIVFPAIMILLSYLITLQVKVEAVSDPKVLGAIAMILAPLAVYEIGKHHTTIGLAIGLALIIGGVFLFVRGSGKPKEPRPR